MNLTISQNLSINAALAQIIKNGGGEIIIPPGVWQYSKAPTIDATFPPFHLRGFGGCVNAAGKPVGSVLQFTGTGNAFNITTALGLDFSGFCLLGNPQATNGIVTNAMQCSTFRQLWLERFSGVGIQCIESYENQLLNPTVKNCGTGYEGYDDNGTVIYNGYFACNKIGLHNPANCIGTVVESNLTYGIFYDWDNLHSLLLSIHLEANGNLDDQEYANIFSSAKTFLELTGNMQLHSGQPRVNRMTHFGGFFEGLKANATFNIALFTNPANVPWEFGSLLPGSNVYSLSPTFRTGKGDWNGFEGIVFGGPYLGKV